MDIPRSEAVHANTAELPSSSSPGSSTSRRLTDQQQRWLADLYQANFASVFRLCTRMLRSSEDAADAAHETFLIAVDSMQPDTGGGTARSWLMTVARNHCLDVLRRRKRFGRALVTLGGNPQNGADIESAIADRDFVSLVLNQLSHRERQALWESAVERRPLADIAMDLRLNYMAAAQVLHRARQRAAGVAARVAVVIGIARLVRAVRRNMEQRNLTSAHQSFFGSLLSVDRILALAAVPLVMVAIQSSSSAHSAGAYPSRGAAPATTIAAPGMALPVGRIGQLPATGTVPADVKSALDALVGSVNNSLGQLTAPAATPSPSASLPGVPVTVPSLPAPSLPVPSPAPLP